MSNLTVQFNLKQDLNGTPGAIISNGNLHPGDTFFVEILIGDIRTNAVGLTSTSITATFNPNQLQNIDLPFNATNINSSLLTAKLPLFRTGSLDNLNGTITNLGGGALPVFGIGSPLGINQLETFSLMHFKAISNGNSFFTINLDLEQTSFTDGNFASLTTPNQLNESIVITPQTVPESSTTLSLITAVTFGILFRYLSNLKKSASVAKTDKRL